MELAKKRKASESAFKQGICLGFAAPLLFLGPLPRLHVCYEDNVAQAWRNVGDALRVSMKREEDRIRDGKA